jgi:hypothetical protein
LADFGHYPPAQNRGAHVVGRHTLISLLHPQPVAVITLLDDHIHGSGAKVRR